MEVHIGVSAQGEEMVVVVGRGSGGNRDIGRGSCSASHELPRPAHRLDRFVIGGGSADGQHFGLACLTLLDFDCRAVKPPRHPPGARYPAHRHTRGHGVQQVPPDGRKLRDTHNLDTPKEGGRMIKALECRRDEIRRPHHRWRQLVQDRRLEGGH